MRQSVAQSVTGVIDALHEAGMVDDLTVREIHALCLPEVKEYSPDGIVALLAVLAREGEDRHIVTPEKK